MKVETLKNKQNLFQRNLFIFLKYHHYYQLSNDIIQIWI